MTRSRSPRLRWFTFSWSAGAWSFGASTTEPWIMYAADPQVTAHWNGSGYEYVVSDFAHGSESAA